MHEIGEGFDLSTFLESTLRNISMSKVKQEHFLFSFGPIESAVYFSSKEIHNALYSHQQRVLAYFCYTLCKANVHTKHQNS
jgi:hypothetical protein